MLVASQQDRQQAFSEPMQACAQMSHPIETGARFVRVGPAHHALEPQPMNTQLSIPKGLSARGSMSPPRGACGAQQLVGSASMNMSMTPRHFRQPEFHTHREMPSALRASSPSATLKRSTGLLHADAVSSTSSTMSHLDAALDGNSTGSTSNHQAARPRQLPQRSCVAPPGFSSPTFPMHTGTLSPRTSTVPLAPLATTFSMRGARTVRGSSCGPAASFAPASASFAPAIRARARSPGPMQVSASGYASPGMPAPLGCRSPHVAPPLLGQASGGSFAPVIQPQFKGSVSQTSLR